MKRIAEPVETTELCSYGCGAVAKFKNGSGNLMCQDRHNKCPELRMYNGLGVSKAHKDGRIPGWNELREISVKVAEPWNKGNTSAEFVLNGKGPHKKVLILERGHKCESCMLSDWLGLPITLELEHLDGNNKNHNKENLKLLCPNCHSQTSTWRRRKTRGKDRKHSNEDMVEAIITSHNLNECLNKLDLRYGSASTIVKVMGEYNVNFNGRVM